ncbi:hypothetical protein ABZ826_09655 [Streptomyces sp. NPDC047515]|uniref:hypothetical protein n=1 Tax=Streptomyces sp. NPDC047515 TaxID=3155380 RepID=UPI0033C1C6BB
MKKILSAAASLAIAATCGFGMALPAHAADATGVTTAASRSLQSSLDTSSMDPQHQAIVDRILAKLPADWEARLDAAKAKYGLKGEEWQQIRDSAINPGDYQCQTTDLSKYANSLLDGAQDPWTIFILSLFGGFDMPTYDALIYGKESSSNTFGVKGEYTQQLNSEMKNLKRFWDIDSAHIELMPMHDDTVASRTVRGGDGHHGETVVTDQHVQRDIGEDPGLFSLGDALVRHVQRLGVLQDVGAVHHPVGDPAVQRVQRARAYLRHPVAPAHRPYRQRAHLGHGPVVHPRLDLPAPLGGVDGLDVARSGGVVEPVLRQGCGALVGDPGLARAPLRDRLQHRAGRLGSQSAVRTGHQADVAEFGDGVLEAVERRPDQRRPVGELGQGLRTPFHEREVGGLRCRGETESLQRAQCAHTPPTRRRRTAPPTDPISTVAVIPQKIVSLAPA